MKAKNLKLEPDDDDDDVNGDVGGDQNAYVHDDGHVTGAATDSGLPE